MKQLRPDLAIIAANVAPRSRVLDIGCGDGALMAALRDTRQVDARGMELDPHGVAECVARGLSVMQGDADTDLSDYPDAAFDYAILSQTLQTTKRPDMVLDELLRVTAGAHNALLDLEELEERELERIRSGYARLAHRAREDLRRGEPDTGVPEVA